MDTHNVLRLFLSLMTGVVLCKKLPFYFRLTRKGFHLAWRGLNISEATMYKYRYIIGDDRNRISLDMNRTKTIKQVLFTSKEIWKFDGKKRIKVR